MTVSTQHRSYWEVLRSKRLAAFLAADAASKTGDGMTFIALPILVLQIHGDFSAALAVSLVFAIPFLIPTGISLYYGFSKHRYDPKLVLVIDAALRAVLLALISAIAFAGQLSVGGLIALLTVGSILRLLSSSSRRLLALGLTDRPGQYSVNGILGTTESMGLFIVGPALGGVLAATAGPPTVLAINAGTSLLLLVITLFIFQSTRARSKEGPSGSRASGFRILARNRAAMRLFALIFFFNLFYGPVEVALPLFITDELRAPATALGLVWSSFGVGAFAGAFSVNYLRRIPQLPVITAIVGGWAICVTALGLVTTVTAMSIAFFLGGMIFGPFTALVYSQLQAFLQDHEHQPVFTLWAAGLTLASPIGLGLAGPVVEAFGPRATFFICAAATAALVPLALIGSARKAPGTSTVPSR